MEACNDPGSISAAGVRLTRMSSRRGRSARRQRVTVRQRLRQSLGRGPADPR